MPKTSSFKMIDWWLLFASNVLVITMAFHTYLAFMCETEKKKVEGERTKNHGFFVIPRLIHFGRKIVSLEVYKRSFR